MSDFRYQLFRMFVSILPWGTMRTKWIVKKNIFRSVGKNFYFCPRKIPADPKYIKFHDNVSIAADVVFCNHDVMYKTFNQMRGYSDYVKYYGCIEIMDNVFIGTKSVILPNVKIGPNVVVAAGSIVTKNLESGGVYAGNPAKRIGEIDKLLTNRVEWTEKIKGVEHLDDYLWEEFQRRN